jgi:hypothetical protein
LLKQQREFAEVFAHAGPAEELHPQMGAFAISAAEG